MEIQMRIKESKLRQAIRGVICESMAQQDILYLGNLLRSYKGTFRDWSEFCGWYDEVVMDLRIYEDEFMDDFLYTYDLMDCPDSLDELLAILNDPGTQSHSRFSAWATALRSNF